MGYETSIGEYLGMCSHCGAIRIDDEENVWLNLNGDRSMYMSILEKYPKDKITHSICPIHYRYNYGRTGKDENIR